MSDFYNIITEILRDTKNESLIDTISLILEDYRNNETFANICLEKSHETRYNEESQDGSDDEEFSYDKVMKNLKKKQKQKKPVNISNQEKAILDSKIRQGEYFMEGEYTATMRTADYLYLVELFNVDDLIEVQVLKKRKIK